MCIRPGRCRVLRWLKPTFTNLCQHLCQLLRTPYPQSQKTSHNGRADVVESRQYVAQLAGSHVFWLPQQRSLGKRQILFGLLLDLLGIRGHGGANEIDRRSRIPSFGRSIDQQKWLQYVFVGKSIINLGQGFFVDTFNNPFGVPFGMYGLVSHQPWIVFLVEAFAHPFLRTVSPTVLACQREVRPAPLYLEREGWT